MGALGGRTSKLKVIRQRTLVLETEWHQRPCKTPHQRTLPSTRTMRTAEEPASDTGTDVWCPKFDAKVEPRRGTDSGVIPGEQRAFLRFGCGLLDPSCRNVQVATNHRWWA